MLGLDSQAVFQQRDVDDAKLAEELGDVLWCLAVTAHSLGIPLSRVAAAQSGEAHARHPNGFEADAPRSLDTWSRSAKE